MKNTRDKLQVNIRLEGNYTLTGGQLWELAIKARPILFSALFYFLSMIWVFPHEMGKSKSTQSNQPVGAAKTTATPAPTPCAVKRKRRRSTTTARQSCPSASTNSRSIQQRSQLISPALFAPLPYP